MFYDYWAHTPSRSAAVEIAELAVSGLDFDPETISIRPSLKYRTGPVGRWLRAALFLRHPDEWTMSITGPADRRSRAQFDNLVERHEGLRDGGGYDFMYDPTGRYTDAEIERYHLLWHQELAEDEERMRRDMSPEERERYDAAVRDLEALDESEAMRSFRWGEDDND